MAEFTAGDRVVKMSGIAAGKYGTVNSVREDGTLNVTFDGERMARFCDPERCGKVAANAVKFDNPNYRPADGIKYLDEHFQMFDPKVAKAMIDDAKAKGIKIPMSLIAKAQKAGIAANREFAPGDKVCIGGRAGMERGEKVETIERVEGEGRDKFLFFKGSKWGMPARMYAYANSRAANAKYKTGDFVKELASDRTWRVGRIGNDTVELWQWPGSGMTVTTIREVEDGNRFIPAPQVAESWKKAHANARAANATKSRLKGFKVGDKVKDRHGNVGIVEKIQTDDEGPFGPSPSKYGDLLGIKIEDGRIGWLDETNAVLANSRACNAEIAPELRRAYDEWQKAKAKFDKWWNPNRRLSERPPKGADATRKQLDFAAVFKKVTGKLTPNGYGSMTLEQMVDAVSKNAVARNGLSPYGAVSGLLALKWYDKKDDKGGGVMIVRAPFEAVKRYLEQSARNYPYKIAPYGRGWAKVTAPFEW